MKRVLAFGLSGEVGRALLARGLPNVSITAVSRQVHAGQAWVDWHLGSLEQVPSLPGPFDAVLSLGPLDAFARWFDASDIRPNQVVALGSTSVHSKMDSPDASERAQAALLQQAEAQLTLACSRRGATLQMLRPTLLYGGGRDRSLSLLVAMARRYGFVLLPYQANGLRQPVHVADVAMAVEILLSEAGGLSVTLDLPGAEVLGFKAMVSRSLAAAMADARVLQLPSALMQLALVWAVRWSLIPEGSAAFLARVGRDQVFDAGPAIARIGWKPRSFNPSAGDFVSKT